jgi:hypothetical protein
MKGIGVAPHVIEVIEVGELRGDGTEQDPFRVFMTYWTKNGEKLAEGPDPNDAL